MLSMKKTLLGLTAAAALGAFATGAQATVLNARMTVDNSFSLYISTDANQLGTLVGGGDNWQTAYNFGINLAPNQTHYLHIVANDVGVISAFLGQFSLSDDLFAFSNGSQNLFTNTSDWTVNRTGFANAGNAPIAYGYYGQQIWGAQSGLSSMSGNAQWIWDASGCTYCTAYFSTTISAVNAVPEPATVATLGLGLLGLAGLRRRKA